MYYLTVIKQMSGQKHIYNRIVLKVSLPRYCQAKKLQRKKNIFNKYILLLKRVFLGIGISVS